MVVSRDGIKPDDIVHCIMSCPLSIVFVTNLVLCILSCEKSVRNAGTQRRTVVLVATIDFTKRYCDTNSYVGSDHLFCSRIVM